MSLDESSGVRGPRSRPVSRRSVAQGVGWSVPTVLVATAAPAFAASPCDPVTAVIDWASANYKRASATSGTYTIPDPDGTGPKQGLTLTVAQTYKGSNMQTGSQGVGAAKVDYNLTVPSYNIGGTGQQGLCIHQSPIDNTKKSATRNDANKTIHTFTFSRPVTNLSFQITDVDSAAYDFIDAVGIESPSSFTASAAYPGFVAGSGTNANPFYPLNSDLREPNDQGGANVRVSFPSVTTFSVSYWNQIGTSRRDVDGDQGIFFTDFTLTYKPC